MIEAQILRLFDFSKIFEIMCDPSRISIDRTLSHERHPITFFTEILNEAKRRYTLMTKN